MLALLCSISSLWNTLMDKYVTGLPDGTRTKIGTWLMLGSILLLAWSLRKPPKGQVIGNWFLFWVFAIVFSVSILYLVY